MASVAKRKWTHEGTDREAWVVRYVDVSGTRRMKTFDRKRDADAYRLKAESEVEMGLHIPDRESSTVRAAAEQFMAFNDQRLKEDRISTSYHGRLSAIVNRHLIPDIGALRMNRLTWAQVEDWHRGLLNKGLQPVTAKWYLMTFAQMEA